MVVQQRQLTGLKGLAQKGTATGLGCLLAHGFVFEGGLAILVLKISAQNLVVLCTRQAAQIKVL